MAQSSLFFISLLIQFFNILISNSCYASNNATSIPKFSSILIFGDSTLDTGNNNYIKTIVKSNHRPYGQSFPGHTPTGRFSDGKLVPDFLASLLGLKQYVPPFLQPNLPDSELQTGVCFASAGSGFDEYTTTITAAIPMEQQLEMFRDYIGRITHSVGEEGAETILKEALVIVGAGSNDFIFNFYDIPTRRLHFSVDHYQDFLQTKLQQFVEELYKLGCRKIVVSGLPPIGCLPVQLTAKSPLLGRCSEQENSDSQSYNAKLVQLLSTMQAAHPDSKILYSDIYTPLFDMMLNPGNHGMVETRRGCCGTGKLEAGPLCSEFSPVCANPAKFMFWDSIHPTESTYSQVTQFLVKQLLSKLSDS